ncbi:uncharacterized protein CIMG_13602 [Coccidioides immitis RS]|uniref:Uncharacterized protein n=1 Tax=Coccidioides immitis (strain RS) TaxID=246410 RepID=A0A0D8JWQ0_COCIM|nr:uncharacterized protein CIMG_13602 [Coccidioides immitis RS]KJF61361.1 hypothetical protein CIMG_13602 [Coccidioides immitis RS]
MWTCYTMSSKPRYIIRLIAPYIQALCMELNVTNPASGATPCSLLLTNEAQPWRRGSSLVCCYSWIDHWDRRGIGRQVGRQVGRHVCRRIGRRIGRVNLNRRRVPLWNSSKFEPVRKNSARFAVLDRISLAGISIYRIV